jgi:hypothetical protein
MKASEMVALLKKLIAEVGDLELVYDCESVIQELETVSLLDGPHFEPPVILVSARLSYE